jgi:cellulose synthase/poly-beta-1,6-N-acetylglucosamine synthase-like glycosyltransferase
MQSLVIFIPVRLELAGLQVLLRSLDNIDVRGLNVSVAFYDDNDDKNSSAMLAQYCQKGEKSRIVLPALSDLPASEHSRSGSDRGWTPSSVDRIIKIKNAGISFAREKDVDFLFLLDADLIMHPYLVSWLVSKEVDIVAGIFWTKFRSDGPLMPNVWDVQTYKHLSAESIIRLREAGLHRVGGLGAATLLSRKALHSGLSFARIPNVDFWGEDKHFCVRAVCLGFELYVDTTYPLFHMYRPGDVEEGRRWLERGCPPEYVRSFLDSEWEEEIRKWWSRSQRAPEGSLRRKMAGRLRWLANLLDPK